MGDGADGFPRNIPGQNHPSVVAAQEAAEGEIEVIDEIHLWIWFFVHGRPPDARFLQEKTAFPCFCIRQNGPIYLYFQWFSGSEASPNYNQFAHFSLQTIFDGPITGPSLLFNASNANAVCSNQCAAAHLATD